MTNSKEVDALLTECSDARDGVVDAHEAVARLSELRASRSEGLRISGWTFRGNHAWANSVWDFPVTFESCSFQDRLDLAGAQFIMLTLKHVDSPAGISIRGASVSGDLTLESVSAAFLDATFVKVGGTFDGRELDLKGSLDFPDRVALTSLSLNMAEVRIARFLHMVCGGCCNFFRARFESLTIAHASIAHSAGLSHECKRFVTLKQSTPITDSGLWLSQMEVAADATLGPHVEVTGDLRMVGASVGKSLRIGVDSDWGRRQAEEYRRGPGPLQLMGGYLNLLRCNVGERTEISARLVEAPEVGVAHRDRAPACLRESCTLGASGDGACGCCDESPVLILNESQLGDLSLYDLSLAERSGLVCLDGATYANIEVTWVDPRSQEVMACGAPGGRPLSTALFPLPAIRAYERARSEERKIFLEGADGDGGTRDPGSLDPSLVFRSSNYRQLARVLAQQGREQAAQSVLIAMHRDQRRWEAQGMGRLWSGVRDRATLYGFALSRVFWSLAIVLLLAIGVVFLGQSAGDFLATQPSIVAEARDSASAVGPGGLPGTAGDSLNAAECTDSYPCMNAVLYTMDQLIPILTLGQVDYWQPRGDWWGRWALVILTSLAWIGTTVLIAGLGSLTRQLSDSDAPAT